MAKPWNYIAKQFFENNGLADHQIKSFNEFVKFKMPKTISNSTLVYNKDGLIHKLTFQNVYTSKPMVVDSNNIKRDLYPDECRNRVFSYSGKVFIDILHETIEENKVIDTEKMKNVCIGKLPIMIKSGYCHLNDLTNSELIKHNECYYDPGGYFLTTGKEHVLMSQDRMAHNEIFVFKESKTKNANQKKDYSYSSIVRNYNEDCEPNITTTELKLTRENLQKGEESLIYATVPGFREEIPLAILFLALNVQKEKVLFYIFGDKTPDPKILKLLQPSLSSHIIDQKSAMVWLSNYVTVQKEKKIESVKFYLKYKFFQNVENTALKRYYLGHMVHQLLATATGLRGEDDRDHYSKKRVETAGALFNNLFRSTWKLVLREAKRLLEKKRSITIQSVFDNKITNVVKKAIETGNWTANKVTKNAKTGISQLLNRHNFIATLSNLRRVITPSDKNSKIVKPRHLHSSQFNYICPFETPEGGATGLQKNLALTSGVALGSAESIIVSFLSLKGAKLLNENIENTNFEKIFLNGQWIAMGEINSIQKELRLLRRKNKIPRDTSVSIMKEGLRIYTDEGRLIAPFLVVENGKLKSLPENLNDANWEYLVSNGYVEYLDPAEAESVYIAETPWNLNKDHTHSLIHPAFLAGVSASTCPYFNKNQSPRVIYQSSMCKQALGVSGLNVLQRNDTTTHVLNYPQKPIVDSRINQFLGDHSLPTGQNLVVAIASYTGNNQEDSVLVCKDSIDNGALRSVCYNSYIENNHKKGTVSTEIKKPEKLNVRETRLVGYSKLDSDGVSPENTPLAKRDIVIGKVLYTSDMVKDSSVIVKVNGMDLDSVTKIEENDQTVYAVEPTGSAFIDTVLLTTNDDSNRVMNVKTRQTRIPQIGDKVASRSAQKGIIGMILPKEDMPFCVETGITPDLIMNPNALPSRMTVSQPHEALYSLLCCMTGEKGDATAYEETELETTGDSKHKTVYQIEKELEKFGLQPWGDTQMISGMTGELMETKIYMAPTYYQRLRHMVDDKIHSRSQNGPRDILSMQPIDGRRRGGGFKMGEMESHCAISHGASNFLIDRLVNNSDAYHTYVCDDCGNVAIANIKNKTFECKRCDQNVRISKIKIPYSFKLLQQELMATGIGIWYELER